MRTPRSKGEVPNKMLALASCQYRLERFAPGQSVYGADVAQAAILRE